LKTETRIRAIVVGGTGYGGAEVVRLLLDHPNVELAAVTSSRLAGKPLRSECPWLATDILLSAFDPDAVDADVVFLCQENGFAMANAEAILRHARIVDLSADFRLASESDFQTFYGRAHTAKHLEAVYGLPEIGHREAIRTANLLANPGCYPTASVLGLKPLVDAGVLVGTPVIDAKSGASGAGRGKATTDYLFSELATSLKPYAITGHRHTPEIEEQAGCAIRFTPHLVPMPRGLEATIHAPVRATTREELTAVLENAYRGERFVSVVDAVPATKQVTGSNRCDIYVDYDARTQYAVVTSVIDNLGKGAAGQAVQNMNLMFGLKESVGLSVHGLWP
jgi:N-acetyl-gamma-glutamyl-phosphate reductase